MSNMLDKVFDFIHNDGPDDSKKKSSPPVVNLKKCTGCGLCEKICPTLIIRMTDGKAEVLAEPPVMDCGECGHCVAVCPAGALKDPLAEKGDFRNYKAESLPSAAALQLLFRSRRSVRHFKKKPLSRGDIEKMLDAARYAPVGGNRREDVNFIVISDPEDVSRLRGPFLDSVLKMFSLLKKNIVKIPAFLIFGKENMNTILFYIPILEFFKERWEKFGEDRLLWHAPAIILVHGKKWDDSIAISCIVALYQASLMGQTLKVGCCFNGLVQEAINRDPKIKKMIGLPAGHKCYGAMTIGYEKVKYKRIVRRPPVNTIWW